MPYTRPDIDTIEQRSMDCLERFKAAKTADEALAAFTEFAQIT